MTASMPASLKRGWSNVAYRMFAGGTPDSSKAEMDCSNRVVLPIWRAPESKTARGAGGWTTHLCKSCQAARRQEGRSVMASPRHHGLNWLRTDANSSDEIFILENLPFFAF